MEPGSAAAWEAVIKRDAATLAARRLSAQQLTRQTLTTPGELVTRLGAVQAQDYAGTKWAVGLRLADACSDADLEQALASGAILRVHAMRGTWQLIAAADVHWMLALVSPRLIASRARRYRELGLDAAMFRRARSVLRKTLGDGQHLTRAELRTRLDAAGIDTSDQRLAHLLERAELEAVICNGARRGKQSTYALLQERLPKPRALPDREEMLAELARRYFRSRGPATVRDFAWWSSLAAAEARAALESIRSTLVCERIDGREYWGPPATAGERAACAHLLPPFDEYLVAYADRSAVLDARHVAAVNAGGGLLAPTVVVDGRVVGTWRRELGRKSVAVEVGLFDAPSARQQRSIQAAARRYGRFLGLEVDLHIE